VTEHGTGRIPEYKPQQLSYMLSDVVPVVPDLPMSKMWKRGAQLDQGVTSTCVGHGFAHRMMGSPVRRAFTDPFEIYGGAVLLDPWTENDDGNIDYGTSVDAGAQACLNMGLIDAFFWAWDLDSAETFVLTQGPLVIGVPWTERMFEPERVEVAPDVFRPCVIPGNGGWAGGHCLVIDGRNRKYGIWRLWNSWGIGWGSNGGAMITDADLQYLLDNGGEFCWPREVKTV